MRTKGELAEQACPSCRGPMLVSWGTSCGRCRPRVAKPKSPALASSDGSTLSLGWLVILNTSEESRRGELYPIIDDVLVLTRQLSPDAPPVAGQIAFQDDFMSTAHATLRIQRDSGSVTIEDRNNPGPSANGTFLNARKLEPGEAAQLCDGDVIRLGTTEIFFRSLTLPGAGFRGREDD